MSDAVDSLADSRPSSPSGPVRTCVGCREKTTKSDLVRVVVAQDACVPDPTGHRPGRGAYVHLDQRCVDLAVRRRAFPRALRHAGGLDLEAVRSYVTEHERDDRSGGWAPRPAMTREAGRDGNERSMSTKR